MRDLRTVGFETEQTPAGHPIYVWPKGDRVGATNMQAGIDAIAELLKQHKPANAHILYLGDGVATDALPGRLIRGAQPAPVT